MIMRLAVVLALVCARDLGAETRAHFGGAVEASLLGAPVSFDPLTVRSHAEATVVGLVFDTLYEIGPDGVAKPHLAAGPPVLDEKSTTARITIRKGVRFHDGSTLTPQDVAASLERVRIGAKWVLAPVLSIHVDGDAVVLTLRAPAELVTLLALPQAAVTKGGKPPAADKPVGSGPFFVDSIDRAKKKLQLRRFDDHFGGPPFLDELALRWYDQPDGEARRFETGNAQLSSRGVTAFAGAQPTYRAADVEGPAALLVYVGFGRTHGPVLADKAFRRAIDLAIARGALTSIGSGERVVPTRTPIPVEAGAAPLDAAGRAEDLVKARAQLADAATRVPALTADKIKALRLDILVEDTRPDDREIAERVVRALDMLGIAATITAVPGQTMRDRIAKGDADLWIGQLAEPVTVSAAWWGASFAAGADDWPVAQLATGAVDAGAAGKAFTDRMPIVPLMFRAVRLWHRTDVRGVTFDASGRPCLADLFLFGTPAKGKP
jgi:ABC-type transport system substrate-binding protein